MTLFQKECFEDFLLDHNVVKFLVEPIILRSGRPSHYYVNCRALTDTIRRKDRLMEFLMAFITEKRIDPDYFLGVPEGATKIALALNDYRSRIHGDDRYMDAPWVQMRSRPKESHGSPGDRYFLGAVKAGDHTTVLEDVITTGDSLLDRLHQIREAGLQVESVIGLVNRQARRRDGRSVQETLASEGVRLEYLTESRGLLKRASERFRPDVSLLKLVEREVAQYSIESWTFNDEDKE
ncbi:MAG: hypothetical protein JRI22_04285 [Deltaproteobacteria bacterium]|nr:hypothetical protein [Deltaproteobacteria bacterium]